MESICSCVRDLLLTHMSNGIVPLIADADDHKTSVVFSAKIDCSDTEPVVSVSIRYTSSVTDQIVIKLDDPDQGTFEAMTGEAFAFKKRAKQIPIQSEGDE